MTRASIPELRYPSPRLSRPCSERGRVGFRASPFKSALTPSQSLIQAGSAMANYKCPACENYEPCLKEGEKKKQTIRLLVPWNDEALTVVKNGEHCLPCPLCENPADWEHAKITQWEKPRERLHRRLRQHYVREHGNKLMKVSMTQDEISQFYRKAWELRCQLIHGPSIATTSRAAKTKTNTTPRSRNSSGRMSRLLEMETSKIPLPQKFERWITDTLKPNSVASYRGIVKIYLGWIRLHQDQSGALTDTWNYDWVTSFLDEVKAKCAPSTAFNYLCALVSCQKFTVLHGESNPSERVKLQFQALLRSLGKEKGRHRHVVAERKRKNSVRLHDVHRRILRNSELDERYAQIIRQLIGSEPLSPQDISWAIGFAILNLQASNFKRNGNVAKIDYGHALKRIKSAIKNRKSCEIEIKDAAKTGGTEIFSVISRKRLKVLFQYATIIRPSTNVSPTVKSFFVSSMGNPINKRVGAMIKSVAVSAGLPHMTIKDLRSRIETEAALLPDESERKDIAKHLAHTETTRDRHYLLADRRRSQKAAATVDRLMQLAPPDNSSEDESLGDDDPPTVSEGEESDDEPAQRTANMSSQSSVFSTGSGEIDTASLAKKKSPIASKRNASSSSDESPRKGESSPTSSKSDDPKSPKSPTPSTSTENSSPPTGKSKQRGNLDSSDSQDGSKTPESIDSPKSPERLDSSKTPERRKSAKTPERHKSPKTLERRKSLDRPRTSKLLESSPESTEKETSQSEAEKSPPTSPETLPLIPFPLKGKEKRTPSPAIKNLRNRTIVSRSKK